MADQANQLYQLSDVLIEEYRKLGIPIDSPEKDKNPLNQIQMQALKYGQGLSALCLSGGGIRSATFNLGVIQALAKFELLSKFDYLSTVSGGGYIGGWLTAWAYHEEGGIKKVEEKLAQKQPEQEEPEPVRHLRQYTNYMTPRLGLLSVDTWTLLATYLRNLLLNWLVLIPILLAVSLVPRLFAAVLGPKGGILSQCAIIILFILATVLLLCGVLYTRRALPSRGGNPDWGQKQYIYYCLAPIGSSVLIYTAVAWYWLPIFLDLDAEILKLPYLLSWLSVLPPRWCLFALVAIAVILFYMFLSMIEMIITYKYNQAKQANQNEQNVKTDNNEQNAKHKRLIFYNLVTGILAVLLIWSWINIFTPVFTPANPSPESLAAYTSFAAPLLWAVFILAETFYIGISSYFTDDEDREWWARSGAWILLAIVLWIVVSVLVIYAPLLFAFDLSEFPTVGAGGLLAGLVPTLFGSSASTPANTQQPPLRQKGWWPLVRGVLMVSCGIMFGITLFALLSSAVDWLLKGLGINTISSGGNCHLQLLQSTSLALIGELIIALLVIFYSAGRVINVNHFSLHAMYRNRLIRAYLGASRYSRKPNGPCSPATDKSDDQSSKCLRNPNSFTGFDPADNFPFHEVASKIKKPLHVINMALNLVHGSQLAWQQRKAESFTVTPLHCGSYCTGYRSTQKYGGSEGIKLGTAMAISGAAFTSNMGYSAPLQVVEFFNIFPEISKNAL
ncbi:MAG: patatin-like phospholipase family protein [Candidatus Contendobacter sp.]